MDHHGQVEGRCHLLGAAQDFDVVDGNPPGQTSLDANNIIAIARNRSFRCIHVNEGKVHRITTPTKPFATDVNEDAGRLWR
jgi:hypothetical protein